MHPFFDVFQLTIFFSAVYTVIFNWFHTIWPSIDMMTLWTLWLWKVEGWIIFYWICSRFIHV